MPERHACVLTTGRQDYGILRSTIMALRDASDFRLSVLAGGMHLQKRFGHTIDLLHADGVPVACALDFVAEPPAPADDAARAVAQVHATLCQLAPDFLLVAGDRSETLAAAMAAALVPLPIVHIHGGEETEGAIDNALRHAITKLSHLHLVSGELPRRRVLQMGERDADVIVVGAPGLDNASRTDLPDRAAIEQRVRLTFDRPVVIVTMHPTTLTRANVTAEVEAVAAAMEQIDAVYVITRPNADEGGQAILAFWEQWVARRERAVLVDALGERYYWGLLRTANAVLGNSSSGVIEAPAIGIPAVDVGDRQRGRETEDSVQRVPARTDAVAAALTRALSGDAASRVPEPSLAWPRIMAALRSWAPPADCRKTFRLLQ